MKDRVTFVRVGPSFTFLLGMASSQCCFLWHPYPPHSARMGSLQSDKGVAQRRYHIWSGSCLG